jgi:glycosyltransferase involved in cell wall biosynthesis
MARRKPVVATTVGGIPEVVADGVSGLLVPPGDPDALATALISLARSPSLRSRIGEAGYATVAERYSIDAQVRRTEELYDEELQRAGALAPLRGGGNGTAPDSATPPRPRGRAALEVPPS